MAAGIFNPWMMSPANKACSLCGRPLCYKIKKNKYFGFRPSTESSYWMACVHCDELPLEDVERIR